jgi:hypothetical protein
MKESKNYASPNSQLGSTRKRNAALLQVSKKLEELIPDPNPSAKFSGNIEELKRVFKTLDKLPPPSPNSPLGSTRKRNAVLLQVSKKLEELIPDPNPSAKFSGNIEELKWVFKILDKLPPLIKLEKNFFAPYLEYCQQPGIQELINPEAGRKAVGKEDTSSVKPVPGVVTVNPDGSSSGPAGIIHRDVDENHELEQPVARRLEPEFKAVGKEGTSSDKPVLGATVNRDDSSSGPAVTIPSDVDENHGQASGSDAKKEPTKPMLFSALEYLARPFLGALNILWEITGFLIKFFSLGTVDLSAQKNRPKDSNSYAYSQHPHPYPNVGHSKSQDHVLDQSHKRP